MADFVNRAGFALLAWTFLLGACNPFFSNKRMKYAMIACAVGATICLVIAPTFTWVRL